VGRGHAADARELVSDALDGAQGEAVGEGMEVEATAEAHPAVEGQGAVALEELRVGHVELRSLEAAVPVRPAEARLHPPPLEGVPRQLHPLEAGLELQIEGAARQVAGEPVGVAEVDAPAPGPALVEGEALVLLVAEDLVQVGQLQRVEEEARGHLEAVLPEVEVEVLGPVAAVPLDGLHHREADAEAVRVELRVRLHRAEAEAVEDEVVEAQVPAEPRDLEGAVDGDLDGARALQVPAVEGRDVGEIPALAVGAHVEVVLEAEDHVATEPASGQVGADPVEAEGVGADGPPRVEAGPGDGDDPLLGDRVVGVAGHDEVAGLGADRPLEVEGIEGAGQGPRPVEDPLHQRAVGDPEVVHELGEAQILDADGHGRGQPRREVEAALEVEQAAIVHVLEDAALEQIEAVLVGAEGQGGALADAELLDAPARQLEDAGGEGASRARGDPSPQLRASLQGGGEVHPLGKGQVEEVGQLVGRLDLAADLQVGRVGGEGQGEAGVREGDAGRAETDAQAVDDDTVCLEAPVALELLERLLPEAVTDGAPGRGQVDADTRGPAGDLDGQALDAGRGHGVGVDDEAAVDDAKGVEGELEGARLGGGLGLRRAWEVPQGAVLDEEADLGTPELDLVEVQGAPEEGAEARLDAELAGLREASIDGVVEREVLGHDGQREELEPDAPDARLEAELAPERVRRQLREPLAGGSGPNDAGRGRGDAHDEDAEDERPLAPSLESTAHRERLAVAAGPDATKGLARSQACFVPVVRTFGIARPGGGWVRAFTSS
jgi:hypothetical protein